MFDAQKLLTKKYGWKQGQGLGKDNDGMKEPISVSSKFSKGYGLGANSFTGKSQDYEHWWDDLYTKSCCNNNNNNENVSLETRKNEMTSSDLESQFRELLSKSKRNAPSSDDDSDDEKFRLRQQSLLKSSEKKEKPIKKSSTAELEKRKRRKRRDKEPSDKDKRAQKDKKPLKKKIK